MCGFSSNQSGCDVKLYLTFDSDLYRTLHVKVIDLYRLLFSINNIHDYGTLKDMKPYEKVTKNVGSTF